MEDFDKRPGDGQACLDHAAQPSPDGPGLRRQQTSPRGASQGAGDDQGRHSYGAVVPALEQEAPQGHR